MFWSAPLVVNKSTGVKFGKSESGAVWLDPAKTTPTQFYQFWINVDDDSVEDFLKIYTLLDEQSIGASMAEQQADPGKRTAQIALAREVTALVHGIEARDLAEEVTGYLTGHRPIEQAGDKALEAMRMEIPAVRSAGTGSIIECLVAGGLASSNMDARRLVSGNAVSINGQKVLRENFEDGDFHNGRILLRKGKAYKDSILVELG